MRTIKYLTPELKEYYMNDFNNNVLPCTDEYWGLDKGTRDILININKSNNIQTIYSRKLCNYEPDTIYDVVRECSFICFLITEKIVNDINNIVNLFETKYEFFDFNINAPRKFISGYDGMPVDVAKMASMYDYKYFNTDVFQFIIESSELKDHEEFWKDISKYLTNL